MSLLKYIMNLCNVTGAAYKCLRTPEEGGSGTPEDTQWSSLGDRFLVPTAESLMLHLARLVHHIISCKCSLIDYHPWVLFP